MNVLNANEIDLNGISRKDRPTVMLFSGIGGDHRLLKPQLALPFDVVTPDYPPPAAGESFADYAIRLYDHIKLSHLDCAPVVGGVSFGAMIATQLATMMEPSPLGIIAIAARPGRSAPRALKLFVDGLLKAIPTGDPRAGAALPRMFQNMFGELGVEDQLVMADMLIRATPERIRRFAAMIGAYEPPVSLPCSRCAIHGAKDLVVPIDTVAPDVVIEGGGHLVNWTHSVEVNNAIERFVMNVA